MALEESQALETLPPAMSSEQRVRAALALKVSGADYAAIARHMGYANAVAARNSIEQYLAGLVTDSDLRLQRTIASERIERLLRAVWPKAIAETIKVNGKDMVNTEQLQYVRTALQLIDRSARLHGLDAPQKLEVTKPSDQEMVNWVYQMANQVGLMGVREADDIMEAEIVEGDIEEE
jgi:hypothetical protein